MEEQEINSNIIYRVVHGSRAYGTHRPDSDRDEKGVCILKDPRYYFGTKNFEQKDSGWSDGNDRVIFDIRKFFNLALNCNPNIIEILYVDESDILQIDDLGKQLRTHRNIFLSRLAAKTFIGYATDQLYRIKNHKKWLDNPPMPPKEENYWHTINVSFNDSILQREFEGHIFQVHPPTPINPPEGLKAVLNTVGLNPDSSLEPSPIRIDHFDKASFIAAKKQYKHYLDWKRDRNPERAALEAKYHYDCKHACHLIRLLRMGKEIITEGKVLVKRPDAKELLDIRSGKFSYEEIIACADQLKLDVNNAIERSPLPKEPDREAAEKLLLELIQIRLNQHGC